MSKISFKYWTDLCCYMGSCIAGECEVEMTDEEFELFRLYAAAINDDDQNALGELRKQMPESLLDDIDYAISEDVCYRSAESSIRIYGIDCFENMSQSEFDSLSKEELIERCLEDNIDGVYEYQVKKIEILPPAAKAK